MRNKLSALMGTAIAVMVFCAVAVNAADYDQIWFASSPTGGGSGSLDGAVSGVSIGPNDVAIVEDGSTYLVYEAKLSSAAESTPYVIAPDDVGGGTTRWHLMESSVSGFTAYKPAVFHESLKADYVYAGASKFFLYSGVSLTDAMAAGGMLYCHAPIASGCITIDIPAITGSTPYFSVTDMTGSGVTVRATSNTMYTDSIAAAGSAYFVNAGNSRHSASFTVNYESGTCAYVIVLGTTGSEWDLE